MALSSEPIDQYLYRFTLSRSHASVRIAINALDGDQLSAFAAASFGTPLLTRLFNMPDGECVLERSCIDEWIDRATNVVVERDGRLLALLTIAPFEGLGMENGDSNLLEIGLLCSAEPRLGRLLLVHALREADARGFDGVVLELLAGRHNKPAYRLYELFGFQHERRLLVDEDDTAAQPIEARYALRRPRLQRRGRELKNDFGTTLFYLTLRRDSARSPFLTLDLLERLLRIDDELPEP